MNRERYVKQRAFFEGRYRDGSYEHSWHKFVPTHELVALIASGIVPEGRSLDLGCGGGVEVAFLAGQGFAAHGLDFSLTALQIARKYAAHSGVHAEFCGGSAVELPFAKASFTLVTDRGCLHHIRDKHRKRYAREVARITQPGGYVFIRDVTGGERNGFEPLVPERVTELFSPAFELHPFQLLRYREGEPHRRDMLLAVMRRKAN
jgi:2-polyprenyl-3-methyl-5-hydroxy-6-metoxy-1,4-benzoquinol methylase